MPNLTIKNIPEDLYARLKEAAATNRRSINSEVILYIERNLGITKSSPEVIIARARTLREKIKGDPLTAEDIQEAKRKRTSMIVVDTNILAYFFLKNEQTAFAVQAMEKDFRWHAPALWRSEFRNVLALYIRKELVSLVDAIQIMDEATEFMQHHEYNVSSMEVLRLVASSDCSAYDCEFVVLARELGCQLVTDDRKVLRHFPGVAVSLKHFIAE